MRRCCWAKGGKREKRKQEMRKEKIGRKWERKKTKGSKEEKEKAFWSGLEAVDVENLTITLESSMGETDDQNELQRSKLGLHQRLKAVVWSQNHRNKLPKDSGIPRQKANQDR